MSPIDTGEFDRMLDERLGHWLGLPAPFRSAVGRAGENYGITLGRSSITGLYTVGEDVGGLGEPAHGRPCTVRAGTTPFEFLQMTYDDEYGKWVSSQVLFAFQAGAITTTSTSGVWTAFNPATVWFRFFIPGFKALYDAGVRPQASLACKMLASSGTTSLRAVIGEVAAGDTALNTIATGAQINTTSGTANYQFSGWQDMAFTSAPTEAYAYAFPQYDADAAVSLVDMALAIRWVADSA